MTYSRAAPTEKENTGPGPLQLPPSPPTDEQHNNNINLQG